MQKFHCVFLLDCLIMLSLAGRFLVSFHRLKEAQENIKKITAEKRVETKKINANSLVRADLYSETKWNFPKAALSCVAAEIDTLNLFVVLANRRRGCDRRKPACPPAEQNDKWQSRRSTDRRWCARKGAGAHPSCSYHLPQQHWTLPSVHRTDSQ